MNVHDYATRQEARDHATGKGTTAVPIDVVAQQMRDAARETGRRDIQIAVEAAIEQVYRVKGL